MSAEETPKMPRAQTVYGAIVYWITILAALICMVGPVISVASPENNVLNPYKLFNAIFQARMHRPSGRRWVVNSPAGTSTSKISPMVTVSPSSVWRWAAASLCGPLLPRRLHMPLTGFIFMLFWPCGSPLWLPCQ